MVPYGSLKIYSKAENGRTVDVRHVSIRLDIPGTQPAKSLTRFSVVCRDRKVFVLDDLERVVHYECVDKNTLKITWDGEVIYQAGTKLY